MNRIRKLIIKNDIVELMTAYINGIDIFSKIDLYIDIAFKHGSFEIIEYLKKFNKHTILPIKKYEGKLVYFDQSRMTNYPSVEYIVTNYNCSEQILDLALNYTLEVERNGVRHFNYDINNSTEPDSKKYNKKCQFDLLLLGAIPTIHYYSISVSIYKKLQEYEKHEIVIKLMENDYQRDLNSYYHKEILLTSRQKLKKQIDRQIIKRIAGINYYYDIIIKTQ